jgi:formyltetrahydrofolate hydrolase
MIVIEKTFSDVGGGAIQQTIKRKNYNLQKSVILIIVTEERSCLHNILVEYKSNILRLIYAVAGKELHLQSASLYQ